MAISYRASRLFLLAALATFLLFRAQAADGAATGGTFKSALQSLQALESQTIKTEDTRIYPRAAGITDLKASENIIRFNIRMREGTNLFQGPYKSFLGTPAAKFFVIELSTVSPTETNQIPVESVKISPDTIQENVFTYVVEIGALRPTGRLGHKLSVQARTLPEKAIYDTLKNNFLATMRAARKALAESAGPEAMKVTEALKKLESGAALESPVLKELRSIAGVTEGKNELLDPRSDTGLSEIEKKITTLGTNSDIKLAALLTHRAHNLQVAFWRTSGVTSEDADETGTSEVTVGKTTPSKWVAITQWPKFLHGNIVNAIHQVPHKEVEMNLGKGIADHFIVLDLHLSNTNSDKLLIYGDGIDILCKTHSLVATNAQDRRRLLEVGSLRIDYGGEGEDRFWRAKNWRPFRRDATGKVDTNQVLIAVRPVPASVMRSGHVRREMNTTKARWFRVAEFAGGIASAVIPLTSATKVYSEATALYGNVLVPSTQKLFGDTSEVQRQTFERESLDQYLELDPGQSCHKFLYLPRNGIDTIVSDRVLFIAEVGSRTPDFEFDKSFIRVKTAVVNPRNSEE